MLNRVPVSVVAFMLAATTAIAQQQTTKTAQPTKAQSAQQPKPAPEAEEKAPAKAPEAPAQPINIKIDVSITDQTGPGEPAKKTISMIAGDRQNTSIRSTANVLVETPGPVADAPKGFGYREVRLNVDARPVLLKDGKISMNFGLEYLPRGGQDPSKPSMAVGMASLNERLALIFESGKPVMVSQAADPTSDRRITVEVTATILK
jgi:hypothetical protein